MGNIGQAVAAGAHAATGVRGRSHVATAMYRDLIGMPPEWRIEFLNAMDADDWRELSAVSIREGGTAYALWADDPVGFTITILGETVWSAQRDILNGLVTPGVKVVAVPAGFGLGKTHVGGYAVCWFCSTNPVGTALSVTTATRMRQVQRQLWPHVRRLVAKAGLPGDCDMVQWKMPDTNGVDTVVAYGFSAPKDDEAAMQGIHAPRILLVVDEAGGIGRTIGSSTRNLLTGDARMLAIGNPPTDDEGSWFEAITDDGLDHDRPETLTVRIPAHASPAITGELAPCWSCPPQVPPHSIGTHLVDAAWISDAIREHGEESPYVVAKVEAKFPRGGASRAIPSAYVDAAIEFMGIPEPEPGVNAAGQWWDMEDCPDGQPSVDLSGKPYALQPPMGAVVDLGVDVAADGGDEMVIARLEGDVCRIRLVQSGAVNENSVDVAGKIREEIKAADALRHALGTERKVHVKVDAIGVGWGVVSTLEAWGTEGMHDAVIVRVTVSEVPDKPDDPKAQWRPSNKRAEMWLNGREVFNPRDGRPRVRIDVDGKTAAQLRAPMYGTNTAGRTVIESKKDMKARGVGSPDRAEAVLLAAYTPKIKRKARILA